MRIHVALVMTALVATSGKAPAAHGQTTPAVSRQSPAPYPSALAGTGIVGTVVLSVELDAAGKASATVVLAPVHPALDRAAESAARALAFTPRQLGQDAGFSAVVEYAFVDEQPAVARLQRVVLPETVTLSQRARTRATAPAGPVAVSVDAEEARRVPGTQGDAAKVVESLPGIARAGLGSGDLVLWGSAPAESRIFIDGIEIPALFHQGGLRSVIASPFLGSVDVIPGAYGPTMGRGTGGLVQVTSAELPTGVHGGASLDPLDATAHLSIAHGTRLRIGGAWREGLIHRILNQRLSGDAARLVSVPEMRDQQLKATMVLTGRDELEMIALASTDRIARSAPSADPSEARIEDQQRSFWRVGARYVRLLVAGQSAEALLWLGRDVSARDLRFGATPARLDVASKNVGVRLLTREEIGAGVALVAGLDGLVTHARLAREGSLTVPAREGDPSVFGQPPGADVNADKWTAISIDVAPFASAELAAGPFSLTAGARLEAQGLEVSRVTPRVGATPAIGDAHLEWAIDPRLALRYALRPWLSFTASGGRYHQLPSPEDLSAVFGTPALGPAQAYHLTAGANACLGPGLTAEATGFYKRLDALPARDPAATSPLAGVLTNDGRGESMGVQMLVRTEGIKSLPGLSGWIAYTLSRSQRQDHAVAPLRLADFDETHVLAVVAGYQRGPWNAGTRCRFATGAPQTPVTGAYLDVATDRYAPILGPVNSARLPSFFQLDLRAERTFAFDRSTIDLYLELLNVTGRRNAEELVYSFDYSQRQVITGLPFLAVAGARLRF